MIWGYVISGILIFLFLISISSVFLLYSSDVLKFSKPDFLYFLILILILLIFLYFQKIKSKKIEEKLGNEKLKEKLLNLPDKGFLLASKISLIFGLFLFILSLAGPQMGIKEEKILRKGVDLVFCIDTSKSMDSEDVTPSRLKRAVLEFSSLLDKMENNRVGLIVFAGDAFIQCPLTLDYDALKIFLDIIDTNLIPFPGTNIGKAIERTKEIFVDKEKKGKFVILLTDGEDHGGKALDKAKEVAKEGIVIYTIGIGTKKGSIIPIKNERGEIVDYKKDKEGKVVTSKLDEELLKKIALETGGKYYYSSTGNLALDKILKEIEAEEKKELGFTKLSQFEEKTNYTLLPALIFLCFSFLSSSIRSLK